MKRIVSVWLTDWPITAWAWADSTRVVPPEPFALVAHGARGRVLAGLNPAARGAGLRFGQAHADACAMVPSLATAPHDADQTFAALRRLANWMQRFTPVVALDPEPPGFEGLILDLTGAAHLFGGEAAFAAMLGRRLEAMGASSRIGVADTLGAAWALARFAAAPAISPVGETRAALDPLPVAALRLAPEAVRLLGRFGLRRVGDLHRLPRAALARRFRGPEGLGVVRRLDQALGRLAEPLTPQTQPVRHRAEQTFVEPLIASESVAAAARPLVERLCEALERDGQGARRLRLTGFRADGGVTAFETALAAPSRAPEHWLRVLKDKGWERLELGFGLDALMLSAPVVEAVAPVQLGAVELDPERAPPSLAPLLDRLTARLGAEAVLSPDLQASWLPERAERLRPQGLFASRTAGGEELEPVARPLLLFDPPEPIEAIAGLPDGAPKHFVWRRMARRVARASGPERLADEWWRPVACGRPARRTRDYYRLEDEAGGRYWVFRDGLPGVEDQDRPSRWWMHGLFP